MRQILCLLSKSVMYFIVPLTLHGSKPAHQEVEGVGGGGGAGGTSPGPPNVLGPPCDFYLLLPF